MKIRFLGTGTSTGIPVIGCNCEVCKSDDWRDKRLRCAVQIESDNTNLIIDCTPDFRQQMLQVPFQKIDGILITHEHFDHVGGIEELRSYAHFGTVDIYAERNVESALQNRLSYIFNNHKFLGIPDVRIIPIDSEHTFRVKNIEITPIRVMHFRLPILGFRINNFAYLTDVKYIPDGELKKLTGLDVLVVSALRRESHLSHQTLEEATELANRIAPQKTYFTHMSHEMGLYRDITANLPAGFNFAFDGLEIEI